VCKNLLPTKFKSRLQQPNLLPDWNFSFTEMLRQVLIGRRNFALLLLTWRNKAESPVSNICHSHKHSCSFGDESKEPVIIHSALPEITKLWKELIVKTGQKNMAIFTWLVENKGLWLFLHIQSWWYLQFWLFLL